MNVAGTFFLYAPIRDRILQLIFSAQILMVLKTSMMYELSVRPHSTPSVVEVFQMIVFP